MLIKPLDISVTSEEIKEWHYRLLKEPLFVPDVYRDDKRLLDAIVFTFANPTTQMPMAIVHPDGRLGGVFYVGDVVPEHEGTLYLWSWGKCITHSVVRDMKEYIKACADSCALRRLTARTPCEELGRVYELLGAKLEGRFARAYKSGGDCKVLFQYRWIF